MDYLVVELSRLQFALTVLYHFQFVPLTLGLSFMLAAIETVYVVTGKDVYRQMAKFWGKLFLINFALGVATGITMEFEFGTNWSLYSHAVGDIFGAPLAIEGLMAFFMESTFIGLMMFGWSRMSKYGHLTVTYLVALGSNLSALWILIANGFMQHPVGDKFNPDTMRFELANFAQVVFNSKAQAEFVHTTVAGYVSAAMLVMGISAFYLLRQRHRAFALRSFRMAAIFGVTATMAVITLGDASGRTDVLMQEAKVAAMEGIWDNTKPPAASWDIVAWPNQKEMKNDFAIGIPYVLTPLLTHTINEPVKGLRTIVDENKPKIDRGIDAAIALKKYSETQDPTDLVAYQVNAKDLGYGLLATEFSPHFDLSNITPENRQQIIDKTAKASIPDVWVEFYAFRVMVALGFFFLFLFAFGAYYSLNCKLESRRWVLRLAMWSIPLPVLATLYGWVTAEAGRQPWTVYEKLPTFISASTHSVGYMIFSLAGFVLLYSSFIAVELYLMFKFARKGPDDDGGDDADMAALGTSGGAGTIPSAAPAAKNWQ
ncbi:cytochrome ubiquinol oxidase subunit I [Thioclava sp.]|uniref:cytochrome ubiquinol oxidase subunit I n=1 Tax=Thioclava sp. TaxID=1933450 RepID=UPI003AA942D3